MKFHSRHVTTTATPPPVARPRRRSRALYYLLAFLAITAITYETVPPARHLFIAGIRCARLMKAVLLNVLDYKYTFLEWYPEDKFTKEEIKQLRRTDRHACHARSSERLFQALKSNAGIYVKLGQHIASIQALPKEWTEAMKPLQDQCYPSSLPKLNAMLMKDMGLGLDDLFENFDPVPIGVASLAQVHRARDKRTGRDVAVKLQHPHLEDFVAIDIATVRWSMALVKNVFPDFEFSWLGQEMTEMLPLEMDFAHEAWNSDKARQDFLPLKGKTALYIPETLWAEKRCMAMEFIEGARIDDLKYLKDHSIDRNQVSQQLARIFSQMVYLNGYFHADPHHGNLLIRPKAPKSTSPFNFDVVLLDHGQYFDLDDQLRVNYARFWLSLISANTPANLKKRRKYAKLVANVGDDLYPVLETAITGRMGLADNSSGASGESGGKRKKSLLELQSMNEDEMNAIRTAMTEQEGLITSIFTLLRNAPRRLIMILKLNDLQRSLDISLATTHGPSRIFIIVARFCAYSAWQDDRQQLYSIFKSEGISLGLISSWFEDWWQYQRYYNGLRVVEWTLDTRASMVKLLLWLKGFREKGWHGAFDEAAGLA